ncbi:hypothetical protein E3Q08_00348 [Wallemia mellicola]|nr:hypothetical protein E3Q08_00348 [Wallemia mellicola]
MADSSVYEECEHIITSYNSENSNNEQIVDLVQNFPNEFFATLLSQEPLLQSSLSLLKVVILSLEGEFKQSAQSAFCDTFSVIDLPYEDTAAGIWAKLRTAQGDTQLKEQLALVTSQRRPLYDLARQLIVEGYIPADLLSQRIGATGLNVLGVINDPNVHQRKEARANTSAIYRQHRFNLHREVAEGFAKMSTLIVNLMGDEMQVNVIRTPEYIEAEKKRAHQCWIGIEKLIGFFDLDPLRALSTILDLFASSVATHWRFFLALLDFSPWRRKTVPHSMDVEPTPGKYEGWDFSNIINDAEQGRRQPLDVPRKDNTSSIEGNLVIAQVLGFQMKYYQRKQSEKILDNCYHLCALLIREDYVALLDLLPHLSPDEKKMNELKSTYKDSLQDKLMSAKTSNNKLAMAAPLSDDIPSASKGVASQEEKVEEDKKKKKEEVPFEPPLQKVSLVISLLSVGALKEAFFMLSLYPHLPYLFPRICDLILRIANHSIEPIYAPISTRSKRNIEKKGGNNKIFSCEAPTPVASETKEFVFFYEKWVENIPQAYTVKEALTVIDGFLKFVGPCCSRSVVFFNKLLRFGGHEISKSQEPENMQPWIDMTRNYFFPGLALSKPSNTLSSALWNIMKHFPLPTRYQLYGEMRGSTLKRLPEVRVKYLETERDSKSILRRLSSNKAIVKAHGRSIAKISQTNPVALFTTVLQQVQSYENIAQPVIDGSSYLSEMSYDVFTYALLDFFTDPAKERTKLDGTNASLWLQSLATFTGGLFRRQVNYMDPTPLITYIAHELKRSHVKDLIIFREIVKEMSSVHPLADLSDAQIVSLSAGPALKSEAIPQESGDAARLIKKSSRKLRHALHSSQLTVPLLVLIAQQLQVCVYMVPENESHPKHLSTLYDETLGVMLQYIEFLRSTPPLPTDPWSKYEDSLPTFEDLVSKYGLEVGVAFTIIRPQISSEIYAYEKQKRAEDEAAKQQAKENEKANEKANEKQDEKPQADVSEVATEEKPPTEEVVDVKMETDLAPQAEQEPQTVTSQPLNPQASKDKKDIWHPLLLNLIQQMKNVLGDMIKSSLSPAFVTTFWQLSMYDISVPIERYAQEISNLQSAAKTREWMLVDKETGLSKALTVPARVDALKADMTEHMKVYESTKRRISSEKQFWFSNEMTIATRNAATNYYIQYCIMPRVVLSPEDALYCARFSKLMHASGVPSFPTLLFYDKVFCESPSAILSSSTENEARNYARFLTELLSEVAGWQKDEKTYLAGARGSGSQPLPGFRKSWDMHNNDILTYDEFKKAFSKWRIKLLNKAFTACVKSGEYMHVRNAVIVYNRISEHFPDSHKTGESMFVMVKQLIADEKRDDLKILAQGYLAQLTKRRHTWGGSDQAPPKTSEEKTGAPAEKSPTVDDKTATQQTEKADIRQEARLRDRLDARKQSRSGPVKEISIKRSSEQREVPTAPASDRHDSQQQKADSGRNNNLPNKPSASTGRQIHSNGEKTAQQAQPRSRSPSTNGKRRSPPPSRSDSRANTPSNTAPTLQGIKGRAASASAPAPAPASGGGASLLSRFELDTDRESRSSGGRSRNRSPSPQRSQGSRKYDQRDRREQREREPRESREPREPREQRERRDHRDQRDQRDYREKQDKHDDERHEKRRRIEDDGRHDNRKRSAYDERQGSTTSKRSRNDQSRAFENAMSAASYNDETRRKRTDDRKDEREREVRRDEKYRRKRDR